LIAHMLSIMNSPGSLVTAAREGAGLSMRALAGRAKVAYTTVSRVEHGHVDPTTGMLSRLLAAAGRQLELSSSEVATPRLADLADAWTMDARGQDRPDWTRLRAFLDFVAQHPDLRGAATLHAPVPSGSPFMDNLLAGMAEKICDDANLPRPAWTKRVPRLSEPWVSGGTPRMRAAAEAATPSQLASRGITMKVESLWRDQSTVGL
jgi:transcriptional regulator with XRE-family HTH domain